MEWHEFEKELLEMYDSKHNSSYTRELSKLKQEGRSLEDYIEEFMRLSYYIHRLSQNYLVCYFVSGLRDVIKYEVIAKDPQTMKAAMNFARLKKEKAAAIKRVGSQNFTPMHQSTTSSGKEAKNAKPVVTQGGTATRPVHKLTYQEIKERREKGLCFNCDEKYTVANKCKNKKIYHLEIIPDVGDEDDQCLEDEGEGEEVNLLALTLSAMEGVAGVSSIRLIGNMNGKQIGFLVDIGATLYFIGPRTVHKLQLALSESDSFNVTIAGEEKLQGGGCCERVAMCI